MNTPLEQNTRSAKWGFILGLATTILMLLGTVATLIFDGQGDRVTKGTIGMLIGTIAPMFGTLLSYVEYRTAKPNVSA